VADALLSLRETDYRFQVEFKVSDGMHNTKNYWVPGSVGTYSVRSRTKNSHQRLRLLLSKGPNRVGASSLPEDRNTYSL
jgi:hypothetical protein